VLVALALGAWVGVKPLDQLAWTGRGLAWGILATAPLLLGLWWTLRTRWPPAVRLVRLVVGRIGPLFVGSAPWELALVATLAGVGEELLFRGVVQTALAGHLPVWGAVAVTAALFGLAHFLTPAYAVLAAGVGGYLGWLFAVTGNLLVPAVTHALYDLVALAVLAAVKPDPTPSVL
jgi:membrane protease YdiL (CAAX protease family)